MDVPYALQYTMEENDSIFQIVILYEKVNKRSAFHTPFISLVNSSHPFIKLLELNALT